MDASVYLMSDLPARIEVDDVMLIAATAFACAVLDLIPPRERRRPTGEGPAT
jgi:hypothetical protein